MSEPIAIINVVQAGLFSTIQDKGRHGLRHLGIPWAGALCPAWQKIANAIVGNKVDAPVIECFEGGLHLQATDHDLLLVVVGCESAVIKKTESTQNVMLEANRSTTLFAGQSLIVSSTGLCRHAIIAVAGMEVPEHLGSASTYAKAALGGIDGSGLCTGQTINVRKETPYTSSASFILNQCQLPEVLRYKSNTLRVIAGPQFDHFSDVGIATFLNSPYQLGIEADRMGVRLHGAAIEHRDAQSKDIVSDAIVPGSIQVPGAGLPIVLLNDAHTAGGYPKIATVISCDLPLLGLQRSGASFLFRLVNIDEAIAASAHERHLIDQAISSITRYVNRELDSLTLLQHNLIDGVVDGT